MCSPRRGPAPTCRPGSPRSVLTPRAAPTVRGTWLCARPSTVPRRPSWGCSGPGARSEGESVGSQLSIIIVVSWRPTRTSNIRRWRTKRTVRAPRQPSRARRHGDHGTMSSLRNTLRPNRNRTLNRGPFFSVGIGTPTRTIRSLDTPPTEGRGGRRVERSLPGQGKFRRPAAGFNDPRNGSPAPRTRRAAHCDRSRPGPRRAFVREVGLSTSTARRTRLGTGRSQTIRRFRFQILEMRRFSEFMAVSHDSDGGYVKGDVLVAGYGGLTG
jgi:hypothetical protein